MTVFYGQTQAPWASEELGTSPGVTIGADGCAETAVANLMIATTGNEVYTPEWMNSWLKTHGGYANGDQLIWSAVPRLGAVTEQGTTTSKAILNQFLRATPNFAIVQFAVGNHLHFSLANEVDTIIDSEDGKQKSLETYTFMMAYLYTKVAAAPAPPAPPANPLPPAPAIGAAPDIMSAAQETQAYQIVLNRTPGAGDHVPTGRSAMQFILDAQTELTDQRASITQQLSTAAADAARVIELEGQLTAANTVNTKLQDQITALQQTANRVAPAAPVINAPVKPAAPAVDAVAAPAAPTTTSTDPALSAASRVHLVASQGYGAIKRLFLIVFGSGNK